MKIEYNMHMQRRKIIAGLIDLIESTTLFQKEFQNSNVDQDYMIFA